MSEPQTSWERVIQIIEILRSPDGCPWDRKQTYESLLPSLLEESYEFCEAVLQNAPNQMCEELGDILLILLLESQIAKEASAFSIQEALELLAEKLVRRHPHVFADTKVTSVKDVLVNWEAIKKQEKRFESEAQTSNRFESVSPQLPALDKAFRIQQIAAKVGFDWENVTDVFKKVNEETSELAGALDENDLNKIEEEIGDLLFATVNLARFLHLHPDIALRKTIHKFLRRFQYIESNATKQLEQMTLAEMDALWDQCKQLEKK